MIEKLFVYERKKKKFSRIPAPTRKRGVGEALTPPPLLLPAVTPTPELTAVALDVTALVALILLAPVIVTVVDELVEVNGMVDVIDKVAEEKEDVVVVEIDDDEDKAVAATAATCIGVCDVVEVEVDDVVVIVNVGCVINALLVTGYKKKTTFTILSIFFRIEMMTDLWRTRNNRRQQQCRLQ